MEKLFNGFFIWFGAILFVCASGMGIYIMIVDPNKWCVLLGFIMAVLGLIAVVAFWLIIGENTGNPDEDK